MTWTRLAVKTLILAAGVGFTAAFFINWCDLVYQCGCTFSWAGGAAHCNIHQASGRHCPWCASEVYGGIAFGFTILAQAAVAFWPGQARMWRLFFTLLASPAAAVAAGVGIGLHAGYWSS